MNKRKTYFIILGLVIFVLLVILVKHIFYELQFSNYQESDKGTYEAVLNGKADFKCEGLQAPQQKDIVFFIDFEYLFVRFKGPFQIVFKTIDDQHHVKYSRTVYTGSFRRKIEIQDLCFDKIPLSNKTIGITFLFYEKSYVYAWTLEYNEIYKHSEINIELYTDDLTQTNRVRVISAK